MATPNQSEKFALKTLRAIDSSVDADWAQIRKRDDGSLVISILELPADEDFIVAPENRMVDITTKEELRVIIATREEWHRRAQLAHALKPEQSEALNSYDILPTSAARIKGHEPTPTDSTRIPTDVAFTPTSEFEVPRSVHIGKLRTRETETGMVLLEALKYTGRLDMNSRIHWYVDNTPHGREFVTIADCTDLYSWGNQDSERITKDTIHLYHRATERVETLVPDKSRSDRSDLAALLYCVYVRRQTPQDQYFRFIPYEMRNEFSQFDKAESPLF